MACIVIAYRNGLYSYGLPSHVGDAHIVLACIVMAYISYGLHSHVDNGHILMTCVVIAYIVMASPQMSVSYGLSSY